MQSYFTEEQWQWMAERHREGYTMRRIARFLGVHPETVRRGLVQRGMKPAHLDELPPLSEREFWALRETGGGV